MVQTKPNLPHLHALFVLEKLPARIRSDVLADGSIATLFDFTLKRPAQLAGDTVLLRDELFAAFRSASDTPTKHQFHNENNALIEAKISLNTDGSGTIDVVAAKVRFPWITLLASNVEKRLAELNIFLARYTLSQADADSGRALVARPDYSDDVFLKVVVLLESSPEFFAERLDEKLRRQGQNNRIGLEDILPDDIRYWNHLIAPVDSSFTLAEYVKKELHELWRGCLAKNRHHAFRAMATTFAAPALVPHSLLKNFDVETTVAIVEFVADVEDHFSLMGVFEVCADRLAEDQKFVGLGEYLLDRLFGDMTRLTATCALFGASFIVATAYLAEHETLQRQPVYWRRLAAAAHAGLVVRVCGNGGINSEEIIEWAMRVSGKGYFLSVISDFFDEPQWRPEWIMPKVLVADVFGRSLATFNRIPSESAPPSWKERIDKAYVFIRDEGIGPLMLYPAVLEGTRRTHRPTLAELKANNMDTVVDGYRDLADDPSVDRLLSISPFIATFGVPDEAIGDVAKVLNAIRATGSTTIGRSVALALSVVTQTAVQAGNTALADSVSEACLEWAHTNQSAPLVDIVARLVECATVIQDRDEANRILAGRLELLAFIMPYSDRLAHLASILETLKRVQPKLAPLLGKALAAARLGMPRTISA